VRGSVEGAGGAVASCLLPIRRGSVVRQALWTTILEPKRMEVIEMGNVLEVNVRPSGCIGPGCMRYSITIKNSLARRFNGLILVTQGRQASVHNTVNDITVTQINSRMIELNDLYSI